MSKKELGAEAPATELYVPAEGNQPSLQHLAIVLGIPAVRLQSAQVAYKPIDGKPYNAKEINWASVSAFISRRLDKTDFDTVEDVYAAALETEYTPKRGSRAKDPNSVYGKILLGTTPVRKGDVHEGTRIINKKSGEAFTVVFATPSIVCFEADHAEGELVLTQSIGNRMFNMKFDIAE